MQSPQDLRTGRHGPIQTHPSKLAFLLQPQASASPPFSASLVLIPYELKEIADVNGES